MLHGPSLSSAAASGSARKATQASEPQHSMSEVVILPRRITKHIARLHSSDSYTPIQAIKRYKGYLHDTIRTTDNLTNHIVHTQAKAKETK
jgi:hypothetical protein